MNKKSATITFDKVILVNTRAYKNFIANVESGNTKKIGSQLKRKTVEIYNYKTKSK